MNRKELTHLDETGKTRMVDIGSKPDTERVAIARCEVVMSLETLRLIQRGVLKKGDAITVAQIAGILAAKKTSDLIPLCHPITLTKIDVDLELKEDLPGIQITAITRTIGKTGVEMEALTAVAISALTIYDMAKAVEKTMKIQNIRLVHKLGGQSGEVVNN